MEYPEEEFLMISGLQHFSFCRRQWALIHVEQLWHENLKTVEGNIIHEHCHNENFIEKRKDLLIARGLRVASRSLGVVGQCDVVEFSQSENGCNLFGHRGKWIPYPIEYKRGKEKVNDADRLQLCCQAMCLEQMLSIQVDKGAVFYHETHRREEVIFDADLRSTVEEMLLEMHDLFKRGYTPKVIPKTGCSACSLRDLCLPVILKSKSTDSYYDSFLGDDVR